jgi:hypothetical protein
VRTASARWSRGCEIRALGTTSMFEGAISRTTQVFLFSFGNIAARQIWTHQWIQDVTHRRTSPSSALSSKKFWTNMQSSLATSTMYVESLVVLLFEASLITTLALWYTSRARGKPLNRDPRLVTWPGTEDRHSVHVAESQRVLHRVATRDQR